MKRAYVRRNYCYAVAFELKLIRRLPKKICVRSVFMCHSVKMWRVPWNRKNEFWNSFCVWHIECVRVYHSNTNWFITLFFIDRNSIELKLNWMYAFCDN